MKRGTRLYAWTMILTLFFWTLSPAAGVLAVDPPTITISTPVDNMVTDVPSVDIQGYVTNTVTLDINNVRVSFAQNGFFTYNLSLTPGDNSISIKATDSAGTSITANRTIRYDSSAVSPSIVVTNLTNGQTVATPTVTLMCAVYNNTGFSYSVNGGASILVPGAINGTYATPVIPLNPGDNTIMLSVTNGNRVVYQPFHLKRISGGREITNISPPEGSKVSTKTVAFTGVVNGVTKLEVFVNGTSIGNAIISNGNFFKDNVSLSPGDNTVSFVPDGSAADAQTVHIRYEVSPVIIITSPLNNYIADRDYVYINGKVMNTETNGLTINDELVTFGSDGSFSKMVNLNKIENTIKVKAANGNLVNTADLMIYFSGIPYINITSHITGDTINTSDTVITGTIFPIDHITGFTINGVDNLTQISGNSFSSLPVTLDSGNNQVEFELTTGGVLTATGVLLPPRTMTRIIDINSNVGPQITVSSPNDGATVYSNTVNVYGKLTRADLNLVKVGGIETKVQPNGSFNQTVTLQNGKNDIKIEAKLGDQTTTKTITLYYDSVAAESAVVRTKMDDGSEAKAFNDLVKVKLAKGSVGMNTTSVLSIADQEDFKTIPSQSALVGPAIFVGWNGDSPLKPYKITMKYDDVVRDDQANRVSIFRYYNQKWTVMGGVVDAKAKTVSVETNQTGYFAAAVYFKTFDDVVNHWAQRDIENLVARGAIPLKTEYLYYPDTYITRAEFVMFLVKALGIQTYHPQIASYADVEYNSDYFDYVEAALRAGLVSGISHDKFAPSQTITREEAAAILARAGNMKALKDQEINKVLSKFNDSKDISLWARNQVAAAIKAKVLNGAADSNFKPQHKTTRAEAAVMIVRLSEIVNKNQK